MDSQDNEKEYEHSVWEIYRKEWETASPERKTELNKRMRRWQELMKNGLTASQAYNRVMQGESDSDKIKERIELLKVRIDYHDERYYAFDRPEISDTEYDKLKSELRQLEEKYPQFLTSDSPTQTSIVDISPVAEHPSDKSPDIPEEVTQGNIASYVKYLVDRARVAAPKSIFNKPVIILHLIFGILFSPLVLLQVISTVVLGCLVSITFGLFLFLMSIIWWPLLGFILVSSWLWYHMGFLRVILLVPGVFIAELASVYAGLMPSMGEWQSRGIKLAICESWPHSLSIFRGRVK